MFDINGTGVQRILYTRGNSHSNIYIMDCGNTNYSTKWFVFRAFFIFIENHTAGFTNVNIKMCLPLIVKKKHVYLKKIKK